MKATRSVLTLVTPTTVVLMLTCLPLFAMVPILANSRESHTLDVQPLVIQPLLIPTPPPVTNQPPVAMTPAMLAMASTPKPIPAPLPPVLATPDSPPPARVQAPELATRAAVPIGNLLQIVAMALACVVVLAWISLHRAPKLHCLHKECVS